MGNWKNRGAALGAAAVAQFPCSVVGQAHQAAWSQRSRPQVRGGQALVRGGGRPGVLSLQGLRTL